jgi:hypothetical protein
MLVLAILKLIFGGLLFLGGIAMYTTNDSTFLKIVGAIFGVFGLVLILPMFLSFTFYAIIVALIVIIALSAIKMFGN